MPQEGSKPPLGAIITNRLWHHAGSQQGPLVRQELHKSLHTSQAILEHAEGQLSSLMLPELPPGSFPRTSMSWFLGSSFLALRLKCVQLGSVGLKPSFVFCRRLESI